MRPLWVAYPSDPRTFDMDKQFLSGGDLLVAPVYKQGATSVGVYFPGTEPWYDVASGAAHAAPSDATVDAPIDKVPVFQRGGSIVPRQMRVRRSSVAMAHDPFTLVVARDSKGEASGRLFLDPGDGYAYRNGDYAYVEYALTGGVLSSTLLHSSKAYSPLNELERIELLGGPAPSAVTLTVDGVTRALEFRHVAETNRVVIRKPAVPMAAVWSIAIS
jgi:alpha 1,3-glucosidase